MTKIYRSGDVNLIKIDKIPNKAVEIKHDGSFVLAKGEATGGIHLLKVKDKEDLVIKEDEQGNMYFQLFSGAEVSHTKDHETIKIEPDIYIQTPEREVDHFADSVVRRVQD